MLEYTVAIEVSDNLNTHPVFQITFEPVDDDKLFRQVIERFEPIAYEVTFWTLGQIDESGNRATKPLQIDVKDLKQLKDANHRIIIQHIWIVESLDQCMRLIKIFKYLDISIIDVDSQKKVGYVDIKYYPENGKEMSRRLSKDKFLGDTKHSDRRYI